MKVFVNVANSNVFNLFFPENVRAKLESVADVVYNTSDHAYCGEELNEALKGVDVLMTSWGQPTITPDALGDVKLVVHTGGSVGGIVDLPVFDAGVKVASGNAYFSESVAEGVIAYMLMGLRRMGEATNAVANGAWKTVPTKGLLDRSVGIVSLGAISKKLIPMLKPFRADIKVFSNHPNQKLADEMGFTYADLDEIFSTCDIVSIHTAKCPETDNMINDKHFKLLKDGALFVNTSRGSVIDEQALIANLKENRFSAVLDVYQSEPLIEDSELRTLDNCICFPHQAGPTDDRCPVITSFLIDDMVEYFKSGKLENEITKSVAERMTII